MQQPQRVLYEYSQWIPNSSPVTARRLGQIEIPVLLMFIVHHGKPAFPITSPKVFASGHELCVGWGLFQEIQVDWGQLSGRHHLCSL